MKYDQLRPFFENKRAVIVGFGREGKSWLKILGRLGCCREIAVADANPIDLGECEIPDIKPISGENYLEEAGKYDIILQSPGVIIKNRLNYEQKAKIFTQTEALLRLRPCRIIGVTGTKGKSTTSSLIHHFLSKNGINSMLIGNIGVPPLERLEEMNGQTTAVCEMSCHQLEFVKHSPQTAVLLNIFPEHLDHYVDFNAYSDAKKNIVRFQSENDIAVVNKDIDVGKDAKNVKSLAFGESADVWTNGEDIFIYDKKIPAENIKTRLCGKHNLYNIAAAAAAAMTAGVGAEECMNVLESFCGLEHRLERVGFVNGAEFINDSISTVPQAAIAAVNAFDGVDCLILGGMDRGISYDVLGDFLNKDIVKNIILLPDTNVRISKLIHSGNVNVFNAENLEQAVKLAAEVSKTRTVLSPAAASYGFFRNFEERGEVFKRLVKNLPDFSEKALDN